MQYKTHSMIKRLLQPYLALLALSGCGAVTQGLESIGHQDSPSHAEATDHGIAIDPPRVQLDQYHSVQSHTRPHQRSDLAIVVASSGGGYRAANLTAGVLMGMEQITDPNLKGNLLQEIDYFSTVSGGGFATGLYLTQLKKHLLNSDSNTEYAFKKHFYANDGLLKKKLSKNYAGDMFFSYRRSVQLQEKMAHDLLAIDKNRQLLLGDIFIGKDKPVEDVQLPIWIANATIIQNSQLFQFTPDVISRYKISKYIHGRMIYSVQNKEESLYGFDIPAAVGMYASATFPYALAGTTLWSKGCKDKCYLQLFDGGIIDNLGLFTAIDLLRQDKAKKKVLIIIDAFNGNRQPYSLNRHPPRKVDLLQRLLLSISDAFQYNVRPYVQSITKGLLCASGAEQVIVAHITLEKEGKDKKVGTGLWISDEDQQKILEIGEKLIQSDENLKKLPLMLRDATVSSCANS